MTVRPVEDLVLVLPEGVLDRDLVFGQGEFKGYCRSVTLDLPDPDEGLFAAGFPLYKAKVDEKCYL